MNGKEILTVWLLDIVSNQIQPPHPIAFGTPEDCLSSMLVLPPNPPKGGLKNQKYNAIGDCTSQIKTVYYVLIWRFLRFDFRCIEFFFMRSRVVERNMFYAASRNTFEMAHALRKNMTDAEKILWKRLKDKRIFRVKFRRQHPVDIFVLDFYCHELKLAIEVDGEIHLSAEMREYD